MFLYVSIRIQGAPIKTVAQEKFIISVMVIDFVTKFVVFLQGRIQYICAANFVTIFGFIKKVKFI